MFRGQTRKCCAYLPFYIGAFSLPAPNPCIAYQMLVFVIVFVKGNNIIDFYFLQVFVLELANCKLHTTKNLHMGIMTQTPNLILSLKLQPCPLFSPLLLCGKKAYHCCISCRFRTFQYFRDLFLH